MRHKKARAESKTFVKTKRFALTEEKQVWNCALLRIIPYKLHVLEHLLEQLEQFKVYTSLILSYLLLKNSDSGGCTKLSFPLLKQVDFGGYSVLAPSDLHANVIILPQWWRLLLPLPSYSHRHLRLLHNKRVIQQTAHYPSCQMWAAMRQLEVSSKKNTAEAHMGLILLMSTIYSIIIVQIIVSWQVINEILHYDWQ